MLGGQEQDVSEALSSARTGLTRVVTSCSLVPWRRLQVGELLR